jgi:hypothetical protein
MGVIGTKHVPEELMLNDLSSMFEMGTGRLLVKDGVGGTAKTVLEQAAEDSAAASSISRSNSGEKLSLGEYFNSF